MKVEFWKEGSRIIGLFIPPLACIILLVISALGLFPNSDITAMTILWSFCLLLSILPFFKKDWFAKIVLSDTGIALKHGKKQIIFIDWVEITDFKIILQYRGQKRFKFVAGDKFIEIFLGSQKLYDTLMEVCPNLNITMQLKDSPYLDIAFKRWLKKHQNDK